MILTPVALLFSLSWLLQTSTGAPAARMDRNKFVNSNLNSNEGVNFVNGNVVSTGDGVVEYEETSRRHVRSSQSKIESPAIGNKKASAAKDDGNFQVTTPLTLIGDAIKSSGNRDETVTGKSIALRLKGKKKVRFIKADSEELAKDADVISRKAGLAAPADSKTPEKTSTISDKLFQLKDTKAVKRSPYPNHNFVGFNFPDFDEFGGNEFRHGSRGGSRSRPSHGGGGRSPSPESLAPDGVFYPPTPQQVQEASHYVENDPYLADPETAKYAAQQPPFFSEIPHKRTVLALQQQREDNGLEPNILRSIRPYFPFFEANNHSHGPGGPYHGPVIGGYSKKRLQRVRPPPYFFHDLGPDVIFYAHQVQPRIDVSSLALYTVKR